AVGLPRGRARLLGWGTPLGPGSANLAPQSSAIHAAKQRHATHPPSARPKPRIRWTLTKRKRGGPFEVREGSPQFGCSELGRERGQRLRRLDSRDRLDLP